MNWLDLRDNLLDVGGIGYYDTCVWGRIGCPNEGNFTFAERRAGGSFHVCRKIGIGSGAGVGVKIMIV